MRPRVFPAEDHPAVLAGEIGPGASMRPRVFPAEDAGRVGALPVERFASMRPRVFPAEDADERLPAPPLRPRFNEAAGIPRGRHAEDM